MKIRNPPPEPLFSERWFAGGPGSGVQGYGPHLPMTRREMEDRGWRECDVVLVTGDAYVDHPSFGVAMIGRFLERLGYRVGVIAQPDHRDVEAFRRLGRPRLFWGVTAGNLDSELACLTVMRKARRTDAYSPDGEAGLRPRKASIVYAVCCKQAYGSVPVVLGGIEASLRRFPYYDYWTDKVRRAVIFDAKADLVAFGMAERSIAEIAWRLREGAGIEGISGTAEVRRDVSGIGNCVEIPSYEEVSVPDEAGKLAFLEMWRLIHENADPHQGRTLVQRHGDRRLVVHPPAFPLEPAEIDAIYSLPFTRRPHPSYRGRTIPAWDMIRDSVTIHRGCYGGCNFCAIGALQGTVVVSRGEAGVLSEIERMAAATDFRGTVSDLGGPTANMYGTFCRLGRARCRGKSCLYPDVCPHLETSPGRLIGLLRKARSIEGVKHAFVSSGVRFDLALADRSGMYIASLARHHVGGRLKIAPEHVSPGVLSRMRKPGMGVYRRFIEEFRRRAREAGKSLKVIEYFVSGHPGCALDDMVELALYLRSAKARPEQVQDFYPAPMTASAVMFYTGMDPFDGSSVYSARTDQEKALQRALLLCHDPEFHDKAREALVEAGRPDLIGRGRGCLVPSGRAGRT